MPRRRENILRRSARRFVTKILENLYRGPSGSYVGGNLYPAVSGKASTYFESSLVMATLLWIARVFPEAPLVLTDNETEETERKHDMLRLLAQPNPYYDGYTLQMATVINLVMDGNAYIIKIRDSRMRVVALWYAPYWTVEPVTRTPEDFVTYYQYTTPRGSRKLDPDDVIHIRFGISADNIAKGMSQLKPVLREVLTDTEGAKFTQFLLQNSGVPGLIISPADGEADIPASEVDETKQYVKDNFTGTKRGDPLVLSGATKVERLGFSPEDLDMKNLRRVPEERISAVTGIPAAVVGFGSGMEQTQVGATLKELREIAYESGIVPLYRIYDHAIQSQLLGEFEVDNEAYTLQRDYSRVRILQEDENKKSDRLVKQVREALITRGEAKKALGYETTNDDEIYLMRANVIPVPAQAMAQYARRVAEGNNGNGNGNNETRSVNALPAERKEWQYDKQGMARAKIQEQRRLSRVWTNELVPIFERWGQQAVEEMRRQRPGVFREESSATGEETKSLENMSTSEMDELAEKVADSISYDTLSYDTHYERTYGSTVQTMQSYITTGFNLVDATERAVVEAGGIRKGLLDLNTKTKNALFNALLEARADGLAGDNLARRIRIGVGAGPWGSAETRARVVARSETRYAQNKASIEASKTNKYVNQLQVIDAQLGETDADCELINGQYVSFEEAERLASTEHPNGTRDFVPIVSDDFEA